MKITFTLLVFSLFLYTGCKDEPTPSEELPEGYQRDIPWPSLDSQWPMYQGNPQFTGRSRYNGPSLGEVEWKVEVPHFSSYTEDYVSPVIGSDSLIYLLTYYNESESSPALKTIDLDGKLIRSISLSGHNKVTAPPIISSDGTIYIAKWSDDTLFAFNRNGQIRWAKKLGSELFGVMNIGSDGTIYGLAGLLHAINPDGSTKWTLQFPERVGGTSSKIAIAPDGKTLYVTGSKTIYAVSDLGTLKWTYEGSGAVTLSSPLIDNAGNLYLFNDNLKAIVSITPAKNIRFSYPTRHGISSDMTMDKSGNLYFGAYDSLFSLDYFGRVRWRRELPFHTNSSSFVSDDNSNIYFITNERKELYSFTHKGELRFSIPLEGITTVSPALSKEGKLYFLTTGPKRYLYCIQ